MFDIFSKKSTITLDCFTFIPDLPDLFPIARASQNLPSWWKSLDPTVQHQGINKGTMKTCPGVTDYFKSGFIIPMWKDMIFEMNSGVLRAYPDDDAAPHHPAQWGKGLENYSHMKLITPWRIKEKTGVNFIFTNTFWHNHTPTYTVPNGVVNYKYQTTASVNMVVNKNVFPNKFEIKAGDPLAHVIPMSDKQLKIKLHLVTVEEYAKLDFYQFTFAGNYYKRKKILQDKGK